MGICIRLDGEYAITGDVRQYVLNKIRIKDVNEETGEPIEVLSPVGYFLKIDSLIHELIKRKVSAMNISTLNELAKEISALAEKYSSAIEVRK